MAAIRFVMRCMAGVSLMALAACETAPVGPGRPVDAADTSIEFNHPLYPDVPGEYNQRVASGRANARTDTAQFQGKTGYVFVQHGQASGDTYFSSSDVDDFVLDVGPEPEKNELKEDGSLPGTFPVVTWASFTMANKENAPMSCVAIRRNGDGADTARGDLTSSLILAVECRGAYAQLGEREAAMLSGAIRTK